MKYFIIGLIAAIGLFIHVNFSHAETTHNEFQEGKQTINVSNYQINVSNSQSASVTITYQGKEIYQNSMVDGKISDIYQVNNSTNLQLVIVYRMNGTAQTLNFDVLNLANDKVSLIFHSSEYNNATLSLNDQSIKVDYPIWSKTDNEASPSQFGEDQFTIQNGSITKTGHQVSQNNDSSKVSLMSALPVVNMKYTNPSNAVINTILTEESLKNNVPPELVKAIAYQESGWQQYRTSDYMNNHLTQYSNCSNWDGTNITLGYDCLGIGIMQISDYSLPSDASYVQKLEDDIKYNIDQGIATLRNKMASTAPTSTTSYQYDIPSINQNLDLFNQNGDLNLEDWYFATLAYNGRLQRNDPIANPNTAYQELIDQHIEDYGLFNITPFPTNQLVLGYPSPGSSSSLIYFNQKYHYDIPGPVHETRENYNIGDKVYTTTALNLRSGPSTGSSVKKTLDKLQPLTIVTPDDSLRPSDPDNLLTSYGTIPFIADNSVTDQWVWYKVKTADGLTGYVASSYLSDSPNGTTYNLEGDDRFQTSASISNFGWHNADTGKTVVLGRGDIPADALTGSVLAKKYNAPLLLTKTDSLQDQVNQEIDRLKPSTIYVLGGTPAISDSVVKELQSKSYSPNVIRISGVDRFETSTKVADQVSSNPDTVFVVDGLDDSPDALSVASYAGANQIPILLNYPDHMSHFISDYLQNHQIKKVYIIGGTPAISTDVENQIKSLVGANNVERIAGADRYATNVAVLKKFYNASNIDKVFFANGETYIDALSGAPLASTYNEPIVLTQAASAPSAIMNYLSQLNTKPDLYFLGSQTVISQSERDNLQATIK